MAHVTGDTPVTTWHEVWGSKWDDYLGSLAPFGKAVERLTARVPQKPIAVSSVTADRLARIGPSRDSIAVVPNGIDFEQISGTSPANDGFDVLFAGRHIPDKNVDVLLRAFDRVAADHDVTLGIIGDGPETERLQRIAKELHHAEKVTFLGFLEEYESVLAHMRAADIFASPSTREGFGITFVEAMAADCTVIAADHEESAARTVIDDGGFLVESSVEGFTAALKRALAGERPATEPTAVARNYDWDEIADDVAAVYRRAME